MSFWVHSDKNEHKNSNWDKRKEIRNWEQRGRREGGGKGIGRKQREREKRRNGEREREKRNERDKVQIKEAKRNKSFLG